MKHDHEPIAGAIRPPVARPLELVHISEVLSEICEDLIANAPPGREQRFREHFERFIIDRSSAA